MRGFSGICDECQRETQLYAVCHVHEPFLVLCGACNQADTVMHEFTEQRYKEERVQKIYVRRTKEGTYDCVPEEREVRGKEKAFARALRGRTL